MSKIQDFIHNDIKEHPEAKKEYEQVSLNLDTSVLIREMRVELGMTQKEFAKYVGKPQSTIRNIEAGLMNAPVELIDAITKAAHSKRY